MDGRGRSGHVAQNMRIKNTKSKNIKNKKHNRSKGAILLRAPRHAATHNKSTTTTRTIPTAAAKKVYEFFVQARERCKKKKETKKKQKAQNIRKRSCKQKQILRGAPGPRPVTYKHTSVRLKIALLQLDYKNAWQKY